MTAQVSEPAAPSTTKTGSGIVLSVILAVSFCHLLNDMMQSLLPAIYPNLQARFGLSFAQIGLVTLAYQITASLLQPLVGLYADRRPTPLALPVLIALRRLYRWTNLYDTATLPAAGVAPLPKPEGQRYLTARTADGTYNDLNDPRMGSAGTRFGRNVPLRYAWPEPEPAIMEPNPRVVSRELLTREQFQPAILLITHNLGIVAEACDRVAVMYAGRIVEQGPVREIFAAPQHPYTRALLRSTISLATKELHSIAGAPPDLVRPPSGCRFHPRCEHAMRICADEHPPTLGDHRSECWLLEPSDDVSRRPLQRQEVSVADEA